MASVPRLNHLTNTILYGLFEQGNGLCQPLRVVLKLIVESYLRPAMGTRPGMAGMSKMLQNLIFSI